MAAPSSLSVRNAQLQKRGGFRLSGLEETISNFWLLSEQAKAKIAEAVGDVAAQIEREARAHAPSDTGALRGGFAIALLNKGLTARIGNFAPYSLPTEMGYLGKSGRGNARNRAPSPRALGPWAARHGLNPFAVSRSIWSKGHKANPYLFKPWREGGSELYKRCKAIIEVELPAVFAGKKTRAPAGAPSQLSIASATAREGLL